MPKPSIAPEIVKKHLRVEHNFDDDLIASFTAAAIDQVLAVIGLAGELEGERELELTGSGVWNFGRLPVYAITSIERDTATGWESMLVDDFYLKGNPELGYTLRTPTTTARYRIVLQYGFQVLPSSLQMAALFLIAHYYENRGAVVVGAGVAAMELPLGVKALLDPWRSILFA